MKRTVMVSAKNTLNNSEFANTLQVQLFNQVVEYLRQEATDMIGCDVTDYKCIYRPVKSDRVYSANSMYLWITNMILNGKTTRVGMSLRNGSRVEFDVKVTYTGFRMSVDIDPDSFVYTKIDLEQKVVAGAMLASAIIASIVAI